MQVFIVADIFGKTADLINFTEAISTPQVSLEILAPYKNEMHFSDEAEAYAYFQQNIGLKTYTEQLMHKLQGRELSQLLLLGFSVGASAVWVASEKLADFTKTRAICFYSSQIRNYLAVQPKIEIDLYFARREPSYDVDEAMAQLSDTTQLNCFKTGYLHGFMNRRSGNFDQAAYHQYVELIKGVLARQSIRI